MLVVKALEFIYRQSKGVKEISSRFSEIYHLHYTSSSVQTLLKQQIYQERKNIYTIFATRRFPAAFPPQALRKAMLRARPAQTMEPRQGQRSQKTVESQVFNWIPKQSMYGIFTYIYLNVGKYTIHGWYGIYLGNRCVKEWYTTVVVIFLQKNKWYH